MASLLTRNASRADLERAWAHKDTLLIWRPAGLRKRGKSGVRQSAYIKTSSPAEMRKLYARMADAAAFKSIKAKEDCFWDLRRGLVTFQVSFKLAPPQLTPLASPRSKQRAKVAAISTLALNSADKDGLEFDQRNKTGLATPKAAALRAFPIFSPAPRAAPVAHATSKASNEAAGASKGGLMGRGEDQDEDEDEILSPADLSPPSIPEDPMAGLGAEKKPTALFDPSAFNSPKPLKRSSPAPTSVKPSRATNATHDSARSIASSREKKPLKLGSARAPLFSPLPGSVETSSGEEGEGELGVEWEADWSYDPSWLRDLPGRPPLSTGESEDPAQTPVPGSGLGRPAPCVFDTSYKRKRRFSFRELSEVKRQSLLEKAYRAKI